jgi:RNA polymerase sigma-70 factor (ECF subfamily)
LTTAVLFFQSENLLHTNHQPAQSQLSDEVLMRQIGRGDPVAFETLYDRYAALVMGLSLRILHDRAAAEQLLQKTFWQVWEQAGIYPSGKGSFSSWLFRLTRQLGAQTLKNLNRK